LGGAIHHQPLGLMENKKQQRLLLMNEGASGTDPMHAVNSSGLVVTNVEASIESHQYKSMLRFVTCGSLGDGKSTLIGRLLYDSQQVLEDHLAALSEDSKKVGTQGNELDFALLLDGLSAEREQGITIDVAYRFISTEKRKFIVADTPGHEQYTRNMVTGASTADVAIILIDVRKGVLTQTRRHSYLVSLLGIRHVVLAINKMDLVDFSQARFVEIERDYREFAAQIGLTNITAIPLSALHGTNVTNIITSRSDATAWYSGPTLIDYLETVEVDHGAAAGPFRMPVQWVNRPNLDFRGFSGTIVGGTVRPGDRVRVLPGGTQSTVARIVTMDGDLAEAVAGQAVTITLTEEIDLSRGDVLCQADEPAEVADQFEAHIIWMSDRPMLPGRAYLMKCGTLTVRFTIAQPKYKVNVNTLEHVAATTLELNEIGVCNLNLDRAIAFDPYVRNRDMGSFIVVDRATNNTLGAGLLHFSLRRSQNIHWQALQVDKEARKQLKNHGAATIWFTGLSASGKSTIANLVEKRLHALGVHTYLLDGDNVRHGLNKDLGFTDADRVENIRRVAEVAKLMLDAGLVVIASFISPFAVERQMARDLVGENEFCEVFVDAPLAVAEQRDPKGLYRKARRGELPNFTGIDSPYEKPANPELRIATETTSPEEAADMVIRQLAKMGVLPTTF
jgi:bifunctional enzyme CysN/CysC